jgi:hypothetical protein
MWDRPALSGSDGIEMVWHIGRGDLGAIVRQIE